MYCLTNTDQFQHFAADFGYILVERSGQQTSLNRQDWSTTKQSDKHNNAKNGGPLHPTLGKRTEHDDDDWMLIGGCYFCKAHFKLVKVHKRVVVEAPWSLQDYLFTTKIIQSLRLSNYHERLFNHQDNLITTGI